MGISTIPYSYYTIVEKRWECEVAGRVRAGCNTHDSTDMEGMIVSGHSKLIISINFISRGNPVGSATKLP